MNNNDILKRLRYTFDLNDDKMIALFDLGGLQVNRSEVSNWLKKADEETYTDLRDFQLASFLNGFITDQRGAQDGKKPEAEKKLNNNIILRKLKIALKLKTEDMLAIFKLNDKVVSPHVITSFFRKPDQKQYRECQDQYLRYFLSGLQKKYRK